MIVVDANILFYAEDALSPHHEVARVWWDDRLRGDETIGLSWMTCLAYIRVFTNPRAVRSPLSMSEVAATVDAWLNQPIVHGLEPSHRFWSTFRRVLQNGQAVANLAPDAYLAALAIENNATLYSTDTDFARFDGLRWRNPLAQ